VNSDPTTVVLTFSPLSLNYEWTHILLQYFSCRILGSNKEPNFFCNCGDSESRPCTFEDPLPGNYLKVPLHFHLVPCIFFSTFMLPVCCFLKTWFLLQDWRSLLVWRGSCLAFKMRKWTAQMPSSLIPPGQIIY